MCIFNLFKKRKHVLSDEDLKWNKMWDLWADGQAKSPYAELMTYQSEVYNGGHGQYLLNIGDDGDLQKELAALDSILPEKLTSVLHTAYKAYIADKLSDEIIEQCDNVFYEHEDELNTILKRYSCKMD